MDRVKLHQQQAHVGLRQLLPKQCLGKQMAANQNLAT